jgi:hypothetical protein
MAAQTIAQLMNQYEADHQARLDRFYSKMAAKENGK